MNEVKAVREVTMNNPQGMHARPADMFVRTASRFESRVEIIKDSLRADGKSILSILTLAVEQGTQLVLEATGDDAEAALDALIKLIEQNFSESDSTDSAPPDRGKPIA